MPEHRGNPYTPKRQGQNHAGADFFGLRAWQKALSHFWCARPVAWCCLTIGTCMDVQITARCA
eukprot:4795289-Alexandrium_andersonii.AAC.1